RPTPAARRAVPGESGEVERAADRGDPETRRPAGLVGERDGGAGFCLRTFYDRSCGHPVAIMRVPRIRHIPTPGVFVHDIALPTTTQEVSMRIHGIRVAS